MRPARPTPWSILQTTPGDLEPPPKLSRERGRAVPDLPELGARNANSFGEVAALPRASSSRPVCSVGFLVASGTRLCKNGGSWGAGEKACAASLRGLWLQLLTRTLFCQTASVTTSAGICVRRLTRLRKRRLGAASPWACFVLGYGQDAQAEASRAGARSRLCRRQSEGRKRSCSSGPGGARSGCWRGVRCRFQTTTSTAHSPRAGGALGRYRRPSFVPATAPRTRRRCVRALGPVGRASSRRRPCVASTPSSSRLSTFG